MPPNRTSTETSHFQILCHIPAQDTEARCLPVMGTVDESESLGAERIFKAKTAN